MTSGDLDNQDEVTYFFQLTPGYSISYVCKCGVYSMVSFGGVCEITYIQIDRRIDRRLYAINIVDLFNEM